jgi:hypothetical protein
MPVGVDVMARGPCFPDGEGELRSNSMSCAHRWRRVYSASCEVLPQMSACINKIGYSFRRQSWSAVDEHQV